MPGDPQPLAQERLRRLPALQPALHLGVVLSSPLVRIIDVRCRAQDAGYGEEERASSHHLLFTRAGLFVKRGAEGEVVADPGRAMFFNAGEPFQVSHPAPGGDVSTMLVFDPATLLAGLAEWDVRAQDRETTPFRVSHATLRPGLLMTQTILLRRLREGTASTLEAEETALFLLRASLEAAHRGSLGRVATQRRQTRQARHDQTEATRLLLARQPEASPSLAAIGRSVGASPFHLARVFRETAGLTIHQYLLQLRLALALERLVEGTRDLTGLALDLGFSSHSHFTRLFSRTFEVSPSQFRRTASLTRLQQSQASLAATRLHPRRVASA